MREKVKQEEKKHTLGNKERECVSFYQIWLSFLKLECILRFKETELILNPVRLEALSDLKLLADDPLRFWAIHLWDRQSGLLSCVHTIKNENESDKLLKTVMTFLVVDMRLYTLLCRLVGLTFLNGERFLHYRPCSTVRDCPAVYPAMFIWGQNKLFRCRCCLERAAIVVKNSFLKHRNFVGFNWVVLVSYDAVNRMKKSYASLQFLDIFISILYNNIFEKVKQ